MIDGAYEAVSLAAQHSANSWLMMTFSLCYHTRPRHHIPCLLIDGQYQRINTPSGNGSNQMAPQCHMTKTGQPIYVI